MNLLQNHLKQNLKQLYLTLTGSAIQGLIKPGNYDEESLACTC